MADISSEFVLFLEKNYPDDFRRATVSDVKDEVINSIISRRSSSFNIWQKIPQWVKNGCGDRIPKEVLNGSKSIKVFVSEIKTQHRERTQKVQKTVSTGLEFLALGYAVETASKLAKNKDIRAQMLEYERNGGVMTPEMRLRRMDLFEEDRRLLMQEGRENQPEKYILLVAERLRRVQKKLETVTDARRKAELEMKKAGFEREVLEMKDRIIAGNRQGFLVDYLRTDFAQRRLNGFSGDVLTMFTGVLTDMGVKIERVDGERLYDRERMAESFKKDHSRINKFMVAIKNRYEGGNMNVGVSDVLGLEQGSLSNIMNNRIMQRINDMGV